MEQRIPTMPQGEQRIPTMPQGEARIPTMPQGDARIPTMPQGDGRVPTLPQDGGRIPTEPQNGGRVATVPQGGATTAGSFSNGLILQQNVEFVGMGGGRFTIHGTQVISADSGESQIYECSRLGDSERYVARVLKSITPASPVQKLVDREKVIQFLSRYSGNPDSHILPLVEHGTLSHMGREYFVEVYPFCAEGDLGRRKGAISYNELKKDVIPGLNKALHTFHKAGFVHRDVKPDNLYYYKGKVVLGDFGITCDLINDNFATDRTKTGTLGYYAPELMSQAAVKASDYYSMGQTLWTLYSGEMMYQNIIRRYWSEGIEAQRNQINFAMMQDTYFGLDEIPEEEHFFEILIRGLLQYDVGSRFNYEKVKRWLAEDYSLSHEINKYHDTETYSAPFRYAGQTCWNNKQLFALLQQDWEAAREMLYTGELKDFFLVANPLMARQIEQIVSRHTKTLRGTNMTRQTQYDVGLAKLMLLLSDGECLAWGDVLYQSLADLQGEPPRLAECTKRYHADEVGFLQSDLVLEWYRTYCEKHKIQVDAYVERSLNAAKSYICDQLWNDVEKVSKAIVQHVFRAMHQKIEFEGCKDIASYVEQLCKLETGVYDYYWEKWLDNPEFYGFLYALGFGETADQLIRNWTKTSVRVQVEQIFSFLEQQIEDAQLKQKLVQFYIHHGLDAYLLWFQKNLDLYSFNGERAQQLRAEIERVTVDGETVEQVREVYSQLLNLSVRFRSCFVDNVYMARMGLTEGKEVDGITSTHLFAYWHKTLYDADVPIGFNIS